MVRKKNPSAVSLGRLGGKARAKKLSKEQLSVEGRKAALARWSKQRGKSMVAKQIRKGSQ